MKHLEQFSNFPIKLNIQFLKSIAKHMINLPTVSNKNGEILIDPIRVRNVKLVKSADGHCYFICTIDDDIYILNFSEDLMHWFTISGITILETDEHLPDIEVHDVSNAPQTSNPKRKLKR